MITVILQYLVWKLALYQIYKNYPVVLPLRLTLLPTYLHTYLKVVTVVAAVTVGTVVTVVSSDKNHAAFPKKKITQHLNLFFTFSVLLDEQLDTFDNQCDVLRAALCDSCNV